MLTHLIFRRRLMRLLLMLLSASALFLQSCHSQKSVVTPPAVVSPGGGASVSQQQLIDKYVNQNPCKPDKEAKALIKEAISWIGTPYQYAKAEKGVGTDCSGFVMEVFKEVSNWLLPRNSAKQADFCLDVDSSRVVPGNLVFFATGSDPQAVSHVGMMLTGTEFIHASSSKGVTISNITSPYYTKRLIKFGKLPK